MDILSDILQTVKLRGTVYFRADFHAPWGMAIPTGTFANFHIVTAGQCWLRTSNDAPPNQLNEGDIALFPHGAAHTLLGSLDAPAIPAENLLQQTRRSDHSELAFGGSGRATTRLICGHFEYDRVLPHPLFESLDELVLVTGDDHGEREWVRTASELAVSLSATDTPGRDAIVGRLAEALFIQALVAHVAQRIDGSSFVRAIGDRQVGHALALMHERPAENWSLASLAQAVAMSRSNFAERFRNLVGEPPMNYLARWRMARARELLLETQRPIAEISAAMGYRSEFAFAKAFKKIVGLPPGALRRRA